MRTSVLVRASFIASKDCLASTVHLSVEFLFDMLFNSLINSTKLEMNLLRKNILPKNDCNSLMFIGWLMFRIAFILAGYIIIPYFDIMCPKNLPSSSPNSVFLGFK